MDFVSAPITDNRTRAVGILDRPFWFMYVIIWSLLFVLTLCAIVYYTYMNSLLVYYQVMYNSIQFRLLFQFVRVRSEKQDQGARDKLSIARGYVADPTAINPKNDKNTDI